MLALTLRCVMAVVVWFVAIGLIAAFIDWDMAMFSPGNWSDGARFASACGALVVVVVTIAVSHRLPTSYEPD